jgi:hypothetical protein
MTNGLSCKNKRGSTFDKLKKILVDEPWKQGCISSILWFHFEIHGKWYIFHPSHICDLMNDSKYVDICIGLINSKDVIDLNGHGP